MFPLAVDGSALPPELSARARIPATDPLVVPVRLDDYVACGRLMERKLAAMIAAPTLEKRRRHGFDRRR